MFKGYFGGIIRKNDPKIEKLIRAEFERENLRLQMIASENYTSKSVIAAQGSILTNKYAEGYYKRRFYEGCKHVDEVELEAINRAKKLFNAEHVNVQPHSGSQANMGIYLSVLNIGDSIMGMDLSCGGHLTHGSTANFSGKMFNVISYGVNKNTGLIDFEEIKDLAFKFKPKIIIAGASAYPRQIDFLKFKEIAQEINAYLMADIAHIAGLIVGKVHPDPIPCCDFIGSTTHKTLRGPRGGFIISKKEYAKKIDSAVFPGIQGGPLMHVIAAKAVAFKEAMKPEFTRYQKDIVANCKVLADELLRSGFDLVTGGTDNHLVLIDLRNKKMTGREAAKALDEAGIVANMNRIPYDTLDAYHCSGLRIGTAAVTSRGMKVKEIKEIAGMITGVLLSLCGNSSRKVIKDTKKRVEKLCRKFPVKI